MTNFQVRAQQSSTFCIMPFTHIVTKTNGEFKLCCRSLPLYNVKDKGLLDVWNSKKYRQIRKEMLSGKRSKECKECWYLEDRNVRSMRQRQNIMKCERGNHLRVLNDLSSDYSLPPKILSIELKLNNICNLKCRMCHPVDSIKWAKDWPLISHLQKDNEWTYNNVKKHNLIKKPYLCEWEKYPSFFAELESISDTLETVWFSGGECLIDPMHYTILDKLKSKGKNINLQYATNLTKLNLGDRNIIDYWKYFKHIIVGISFDGLYDVFNYIRTNAKFSEVVKNIQLVKDATEKGLINTTIMGACTFQAYNIFDLPEMFDFLVNNEMLIHSHRVTYPRFLSCQILPKELKEIISKKINHYIEDVKKREWKMSTKKSVIKNSIDNLNFMNGEDLNFLWSQFLEYNKIIDKAVNSKPLEEVRPEIRKFMI